MEARKGSQDALRVLSLRKDANLLLTTILWGRFHADSPHAKEIDRLEGRGAVYFLALDDDILVLWSEEKRIVTGADLLGRLLRGIVQTSGLEGSVPAKP